jgi:hypothetical protein
MSLHSTELTTELSHPPPSYFTSLHSTELTHQPATSRHFTQLNSLANQPLHVASLNWTDNWTLTHQPATSRHLTQQNSLTNQLLHATSLNWTHWPTSYFTPLHSTELTHQIATSRHFTQLNSLTNQLLHATSLNWTHSPTSYFTPLHSTEFTHQPASSLLSGSRKQLPSASWQTTFCLKFSSRLVNVCATTALTALWFEYSQIKPRFHHLLLVWCDWEICGQFCGIALKKVKVEDILCVLCAPVNIIGTHFRQNLW